VERGGERLAARQRRAEGGGETGREGREAGVERVVVSDLQ
jgi:hypothetical protein